MCTAGTEIGAKLEQAFSNCMSGPATRSLMRNSCPSVDEVRAWVESAIGEVDDYDYDYAAQAIEECLSGSNDCPTIEDAITFIETELGDQIPDDIADAIMNCMSEFDAGRKSLMRNGCPSFGDIMSWVEANYTDDACILSEIGWMNNDYSFNEESIMVDIGSLDATVAAQITEDAMAECAAEKIEEMTSDASECLSAYSEEEMQQLSQVGTQIAHYECFLELFEEGCTDYLTGATGSGMENENGK